MKKTIITAIAAISVAASAHADLIAGWDWGNISTGSTSINANYSDIGGDGVSANAYGTFLVDGTNGSSSGNFSGLGGNMSYRADQSLTSGTAIIGRSGVGSTFVDDTKSIGIIEDISFVFAVDTQGAAYQDFTLSYAASTRTGGSADLIWDYKIGNGSFNAIETDTINVAADTGSALTLASVISGGTSDLVYFRATGDGITSTNGNQNAIFFDNIQVAGTVVPEPSAFATMLGLASLALVGLRRRLR